MCGRDQATKFAQRENSVVHSSQKSAATLFRRAFLALCTTEFCLCANFVAWSTKHRVSHRNIKFFVLNYIVDTLGIRLALRDGNTDAKRIHMHRIHIAKFAV